MEETTHLTLQAIVEPASQTVRWVNRERQNPALPLTEFVRSKRPFACSLIISSPAECCRSIRRRV
jgi:hypothetical protein